MRRIWGPAKMHFKLRTNFIARVFDHAWYHYLPDLRFRLTIIIRLLKCKNLLTIAINQLADNAIN